MGNSPLVGNGGVAKWGMTGRTEEPLPQNLIHYIQVLTYFDHDYFDHFLDTMPRLLFVFCFSLVWFSLLSFHFIFLQVPLIIIFFPYPTAWNCLQKRKWEWTRAESFKLSRKRWYTHRMLNIIESFRRYLFLCDNCGGEWRTGSLNNGELEKKG